MSAILGGRCGAGEEGKVGGEAQGGGLCHCLSVDRQFSLAGGADDAWADTEDITEEDCALRSVTSCYRSGLVLGTGCLTSSGHFHTDGVYSSLVQVSGLAAFLLLPSSCS